MSERPSDQQHGDKEHDPVREAWAKVVSIAQRYPWHRDMDAAINEMTVALSTRSAVVASEPVCYVMMNAAGKMYWDEDSCVWSHPGDAEATLENEQDADPDAGWRVVPLHPSVQSAIERTDNARLLWLETLLKHCPHADLTWNDDADEGPLGWRLLVESCSRLDLRAPTLEALIDLGMKAEPDEDGDVVANATDATTDRCATNNPETS